MSAEAVAETNTAPGIVPAAPWRIAELELIGGYRLRLLFRDGTMGVADLAPLIAAPDAGLFGALQDERQFAAVRLELGVPTWPNGADLDPTWLYDEIRASGQWPAGATDRIGL
jgi:hypothetical protein